jgi:hypothetical protein
MCSDAARALLTHAGVILRRLTGVHGDLRRHDIRCNAGSHWRSVAAPDDAAMSEAGDYLSHF